MEEVKYRILGFGVSETVLLKGLYLQMMKVKLDLKNF